MQKENFANLSQNSLEFLKFPKGKCKIDPKIRVNL